MFRFVALSLFFLSVDRVSCLVFFLCEFFRWLGFGFGFCLVVFGLVFVCVGFLGCRGVGFVDLVVVCCVRGVVFCFCVCGGLFVVVWLG